MSDENDKKGFDENMRKVWTEGTSPMSDDKKGLDEVWSLPSEIGHRIIRRDRTRSDGYMEIVRVHCDQTYNTYRGIYSSIAS
jgi:hypothetical protein